jgi:hypothetical protein
LPSAFGQAADVAILQIDDEHLDERLVGWAEPSS